jgi:hypothetical protein
LVKVAPPVVTVAPLPVGHAGSVAAVPAVVQRNVHRALAAGAVGLTIWPTV